MQYYLWQLGYYKSTFDGVLGSNSAKSLLAFYVAHNQAEVKNQVPKKPEDRTVGPNGLQSTIAIIQNKTTEEWRFRTKRQIVVALKAVNEPDIPQIIDDLKSKLSDDMRW